ncbi:MAG: hypothetical protein KBE04_08190 [Phycisphaerae bacterium]|nr:hypothetical protein [Phycisphaerae bacterium]
MKGSRECGRTVPWLGLAVLAIVGVAMARPAVAAGGQDASSVFDPFSLRRVSVVTPPLGSDTRIVVLQSETAPATLSANVSVTASDVSVAPVRRLRIPYHPPLRSPVYDCSKVCP